MDQQTTDLRELRMKEEKAEKWFRDLLRHIKKQHPHLKKRWWEKGLRASKYAGK